MSAQNIEIIGPDLLARRPDFVEEVYRMQTILGLSIGWHYVLDISWILDKLTNCDLTHRATVLDAGAGTGLLQFLLAERGYDVISVDFSNRRKPRILSHVYSIEDVGGRSFSEDYVGYLDERRRERSSLLHVAASKFRRPPQSLCKLIHMWLRKIAGNRRPGHITFYRADIREMPFPDNHVDAVVSMSAIEHMERTSIYRVPLEFERVIKPGGTIICTTSAARDKDWFHEPSRGWCFSEQTLRTMFDIDKDITSNWNQYARILDRIRHCSELQNRLSPLYRRSGNNGMPWGIWDPKYLPVGIMKTLKSEQEDSKC